MVHKIWASVVGVVVAFVLIVLVQFISARFYPLPEGVSMSDRASMERHIRSLPITAFVFVLVAYALGTVGGVAAATRVGRSRGPGYAVGVVLLAATLLNLTMFWHPAWFWVASIAIVIGATFGMTRNVPSPLAA